jgi:hypothetical protein
MHFLFAASNCSPFVGMFAAVNESVWEHAKLLLTPMLLWWLCLCQNPVKPAVLSTYLAVALLFGIYAIVSEVFAYEQLWFDIVLFAFCVSAGQAMGVAAFEKDLLGKKYDQLWLALLVLLIACMCLFTFTWVPTVPYFFLDHARHVYGPYCSPSNTSSVFR